MERVKRWLWWIGLTALVVDATVRLVHLADSQAHSDVVDAVVRDEVERAMRSVAERAYRAGFVDGAESTGGMAHGD